MLATSPFSFANHTTNYTGTPSATVPGTSCTPGTSNADGSVAACLTAVPHGIHYLEIGLSGFLVSTAAHYCLLDILIDPAGGTAWDTTNVLINNLVCGFTAAGAATVGTGLWYHFPLYIPSGASIGARARTSHTVAAAGRVHVWASGNPSRPEMWWCGSKVETLGITEASSIGTSVTPGNSGSWGSWTNIGSTSSGRYGAVQLGINGTDAASAALGYWWQLGYGSQPVPGSPTLFFCQGTGEGGAHNWHRGPVWCDIPEGTQMQARATCSGTAEVFAGGAAIYGVH